MNYKQKEKQLLQMDFQDLDFDKLPQLLGAYLRKTHGDKSWSQEMVGQLMGKPRSHINKAELNTSNMGLILLFQFYVVDDLNLNKMMKEFLEDLKKSPRVFQKPK